jgi:predicted Zn-dependent peptidase
MSTVLGGGMSSKLFQEIREKRGMAYAIYSYLQCYTDGGLFGVYAGTDKAQVAELVPLIFDQIKEIAGGLAEHEILRARAQIKAGILMSLESTSSRSEQLARQMMVFKKPLSIDETIAKVEAVDEDAIKRVAERLLASPPTLTTLGPE